MEKVNNRKDDRCEKTLKCGNFINSFRLEFKMQ